MAVPSVNIQIDKGTDFYNNEKPKCTSRKIENVIEF